MLLSKIMNDQPTDVNVILSGKLAIKYISRDIDAMKAIAVAYKERSLHKFESIKNDLFYEEIQNDFVVKSKLQELSERLLEQNLQRLLEPFSKVEISHIAKLIDLPIDVVQRKLDFILFVVSFHLFFGIFVVSMHRLSQMVLDSKFNGILDQGEGAIIVFDKIDESVKCLWWM